MFELCSFYIITRFILCRDLSSKKVDEGKGGNLEHASEAQDAPSFRQSL
jgi:hypothetical protein